jgi:hypothetical protein
MTAAAFASGGMGAVTTAGFARFRLDFHGDGGITGACGCRFSCGIRKPVAVIPMPCAGRPGSKS